MKDERELARPHDKLKPLIEQIIGAVQEAAGRYGDRVYEAYPDNPKALVRARGAAT